MEFGQRKLVLAIAFAAFVPFAAPNTAAQDTRPFGVGMDLGTIDAQASSGARPDYGVIWVGPWTLKGGWAGVDSQLSNAKAKGVTPVVQYYYWGNDISVNCLEYGCWSNLHGAYKNKAGWAELGRQLADHLRWKMGGSPVIVILETEFNKGSAATYEPLDGYLAERAWALRNGYGGTKIALGFGNWGSSEWSRFDRAMAASHYAGIQGMKASTRDSDSSYFGVVDQTLSGAKTLQAKFGKPVFITDLAVASYPEPDWLWKQASVIGSFFSRVGEFKSAGVHGVIYRSFRDSPGATTAEYFGEAERHWGLAWAGGGMKPAWEKWKTGVAAARSGTSLALQPAPAPTTSTSGSSVPLSTTSPVTIEAERFATKSAGGAQGDSTASAGQRWNLWSNGRLSQPVQVPAAGTFEVRVRVQGQILSNVAPHLNVYVDGTRIASRDPWSGGWSEAVGTFTASGAGSRTIHVEYTNDAAASWGDRNLLVDKVQVAPVSGGTSSTSAASPGTIEAERFASKPVGGLQGDATASGGQRWNLWANGRISQPIQFPSAGTYEIRVRTQGQILSNIAPHLNVWLDGTKVAQRDPWSGSWTEAVGSIWIPGATTRTLHLEYTNDAAASWGDRNLLVDKVEIVRIG